MSSAVDLKFAENDADFRIEFAPTMEEGINVSFSDVGKEGVSCTHEWNGTVLAVTSASGTSSADLKGDPGPQGETGPRGETGAVGKDGYTPVKGVDYFDGQPGQNGVSCTHSWNGTTLTVTSASGTSSADLKGEKGDPGSGDMLADVYDPQGKAQDAFAYADGKVKTLEKDVFDCEYTRVEYVESTGAQYIDTGISGNSDDLTITIRFNLLSFKSYGGIFGNYVNEDVNCWRLIQTANAEERCYWTANVKASTSSTATIAKNVINTVVLNADEIIVNDIAYPRTYGSKGTDNDTNIAIFSNKCGSAGSAMRLYEFKIADGGTVVRYFIPVKRTSDGVIGLYDLVNDVFYANAGSGTFSSGGEIFKTVPIGKGGTGATNAAEARTALGVPSTNEMNTAIEKAVSGLGGSDVEAMTAAQIRAICT